MTEIMVSDDVRANVRAVYELSLERAGLPINHKEQPFEMFFRAGEFCFKRLDELQNDLADLCEDTGMGTGVTGFSGDEIKGLSKQDAARLMDITAKQYIYDRMKADVINLMLSYAAKNEENIGEWVAACQCEKCIDQ